MDAYISKYKCPNPHWKQLILAVNFFSSRSINEIPIRTFVLDTYSSDLYLQCSRCDTSCTVQLPPPLPLCTVQVYNHQHKAAQNPELTNIYSFLTVYQFWLRTPSPCTSRDYTYSLSTANTRPSPVHTP
jgi:hypothetical protein